MIGWGDFEEIRRTHAQGLDPAQLHRAERIGEDTLVADFHQHDSGKLGSHHERCRSPSGPRLTPAGPAGQRLASSLDVLAQNMF